MECILFPIDREWQIAASYNAHSKQEWVRHGSLAGNDEFCAGGEACSFSGAARVLGVGQPAVSKTVAQLEDKLQVSWRCAHPWTHADRGQLRFYERACVADPGG
jgi:hypothetical protein